jgi:hypothetical protein
MLRLHALPTRIACGVSAMLLLCASSGWARGFPGLPPGHAESPALLARLDEAAADSTLEPWQQEFMRALTVADAGRGTMGATPGAIGTGDATSGA